MNMMSQIILEGDLVRDAEVKDLVIGSKLVQFTIATTRTYRIGDGETAEEVFYFDIEAYGAIAAVLDKLKKGRGVRIVGRLKQNRWKDADGKEMSKVVVVSEHIGFKPFKEEK